MIDCKLEKLITLNQAAKALPSSKRGKALNLSTVWRWVRRPSNRLESITIGGRRFTSIEAIARFIERCNSKVPSASANPSERAKNAGKELRKLIGGDHA